jgi:hypothetical protein
MSYAEHAFGSPRLAQSFRGLLLGLMSGSENWVPEPDTPGYGGDTMMEERYEGILHQELLGGCEKDL